MASGAADGLSPVSDLIGPPVLASLPPMSVGLVRYTRAMPDIVRELLVTSAAIDKLGRRGIGVGEAEQLFKNAHRTAPRRTNGGRYLTLVVEETIEPTTWLIVSGWDSSESERKIL